MVIFRRYEVHHVHQHSLMVSMLASAYQPLTNSLAEDGNVLRFAGYLRINDKLHFDLMLVRGIRCCKEVSMNVCSK